MVTNSLCWVAPPSCQRATRQLVVPKSMPHTSPDRKNNEWKLLKGVTVCGNCKRQNCPAGNKHQSIITNLLSDLDLTRHLNNLESEWAWKGFKVGTETAIMRTPTLLYISLHARHICLHFFLQALHEDLKNVRHTVAWPSVKCATSQKISTSTSCPAKPTWAGIGV